MRSLLQMKRVGDEVGFVISSSSLVYDARNNLAKQAIENGFDRILWLDSDMSFSADLMARLMADMDENNLEMVGGLYFARKAPVVPVCYQKVGYYHNEETDEVTPCALNYYAYPQDQLFPVEGIGFGAVLVDVALVKR
ncbi:hypothetical protein RCJ22_04715, partial [Vibrio sp. FNV 38]|nr:hypothetical protein [Vibrio sp. FNV 38]